MKKFLLQIIIIILITSASSSQVSFAFFRIYCFLMHTSQVSFAFFRIYCFPMVILRATYVHARHAATQESWLVLRSVPIADESATATNTTSNQIQYTSLATTNNPLIQPTWAFFNLLLGILYLLHCYWFFLILRSGLNFLRTGKAKDMIANLSSLDLRSAGGSENFRNMRKKSA